MRIQVRQATFETNSSSVHALVIFDGTRSISYPSTLVLENIHPGYSQYKDKVKAFSEKIEVITTFCYYLKASHVWDAVSRKLSQKGITVVPKAGTVYENMISPDGKLMAVSDEESNQMKKQFETGSCQDIRQIMDMIFPMYDLDDKALELYEKLIKDDKLLSDFLFDERSYISREPSEDIPIDPVSAKNINPILLSSPGPEGLEAVLVYAN